ncbi:MAG: hypothetical protein ACI9MR_002090 [Myxococcota bacterium]|jgi:hypothetical protein
MMNTVTRCMGLVLTMGVALMLASTPSIAQPSTEPPPTAPPTPETPVEPPSRPCKRAAPGERFKVDFADAPLISVARLLSCAAGRNIMFSPTLLGTKKVTVIGPRPVTLRDFDRLWLAVLANNGLKRERRGAYDIILAVGHR